MRSISLTYGRDGELTGSAGPYPGSYYSVLLVAGSAAVRVGTDDGKWPASYADDVYPTLGWAQIVVGDVLAIAALAFLVMTAMSGVRLWMAPKRLETFGVGRESSPTPVYEQIRAQIEGMVRVGALHDGDRLPSVRQLAGDLRIAPGTVAKAYTELADCGIIDTGAGRAARVKRVKPIPEPLVRAAKTYADEARRLGASLDDAFNALRAQW